jgi:hypothetical protein
VELGHFKLVGRFGALYIGQLEQANREISGRAATYIYFHLFVQASVEDEAMRNPNTVRLHRVSRGVRKVAHVRVVEVSNLFAALSSIRIGLVKGGPGGNHLELRLRAEGGYIGGMPGRCKVQEGKRASIMVRGSKAWGWEAQRTDHILTITLVFIQFPDALYNGNAIIAKIIAVQ